MIPRLHLLLLFSVLLLLVACGKKNVDELNESAPDPTTSQKLETAPPSQLQAVVGNHALASRSAIFMWREGADDMQLIFSDAEDLCATMSAGAWPKGSTVLMLTLKHNDASNRDAPFDAGEYLLRSRDKEKAPQDIKQALFLALDATCAPRSQAKATAGVVRLSGGPASIGGTAEGELELTFDGGNAKGRFSAAFCKPPEMEPRGCE